MLKTSIKTSSPLAAISYVGINLLFVAKYSLRVSPHLWPLIPLAALFYILLFVFMPRLLAHGGLRRPLFIALCVLGLGLVVLQYATDPFSLQVDRWSALHFPLQNLVHGQYPYTAQTHLGGYASPLPVWQLFHLPFFLMGNVGLSVFAVMAFFFWTVYRRHGFIAMLHAMTFTLCSVAVVYEVIVRSDLITNLMLVAAIINLLYPHFTPSFMRRHWCTTAVCVALFTCTRLTVLLPITLFLLPHYLHVGLKRQTAMVAVFAVVLVASLIWVALWDSQLFFHFAYNPWTLQTRQGHVVDFLLFVPLFCYMCYWQRGSETRYLAATVLMLLVFVSVTFLHNMILECNYNLFSPAFDITYFSQALPFCILLFSRHDAI